MNKAHLEAIAKIQKLVSGVKTDLSEKLSTAHDAKDGSIFHVEGELVDGSKILIGENFEAAKTPENGTFEMKDGSRISIADGLITKLEAKTDLAEDDEAKEEPKAEDAKEEMAEGDEEKIAALEARVQAIEEILKQIMESVEPEEEVVEEELSKDKKENSENDFSAALSEIKKQLDETKEVVTKLAGLPAANSPRAKRNVLGQTREDIDSKKAKVLDSFNRVNG